MIKITLREKEIISWVAEGKTALEIGVILGRSEHTIRKHVRNISEKLEVMNSAHLVAKAMRRGIIT